MGHVTALAGADARAGMFSRKLSRTFLGGGLGLLLGFVVAVPTAAQAATFNIPDGDVAGLIAAINTANGNGVADTINLAPGGTYTLTTVDPSNLCSGGATGLPSISSQITINGNGATIQRSAAVGIPFFRIFCVSDNLTLNDVTVSGGGSPTATSFAGSVLTGGGISTRFGSPALVTLNSSTVSGNTATSAGGGIFIRSSSTLILNSSTISGNTVGVMPGSGTGGGISNFGSTTITNSTVSGNSATSSSGGIITGFSGTLTLTNSTVSGNSGQFGAGGIRSFGGSTLTIKNTIVANSTSGDDCAGVITIEGNNFIESPGACVIVGSGTFNGGFDPLLGPLADNGGPTQTHALLAGSPAIDAGSPDCPPPATDQRGVARPQGAACDIGSVELESPVLEVAIDIKPGSDPNCFNIDGRGVVPVAILGSAELDVTGIDIDSLVLEGLDVAIRGKDKPMAHIEDVDGDGIDDLVVQFEDDPTNWTGATGTATLTGQALVGSPPALTSIEGTDSICIVP